MKLEELAQRVMDDWNVIATPIMLHALRMENGPDKDDIWRTLLKIRWPWSIVLVEDIPTGLLTKAYSCEFSFSGKLPQSYKMASVIVAGMSYVLRQRSDRHLIAVFDDQHYGYGFRHEGKDDISIRELNAFRHVT